jgi:hypothetical protein
MAWRCRFSAYADSVLCRFSRAESELTDTEVWNHPARVAEFGRREGLKPP